MITGVITKGLRKPPVSEIIRSKKNMSKYAALTTRVEIPLVLNEKRCKIALPHRKVIIIRKRCG